MDSQIIGPKVFWASSLILLGSADIIQRLVIKWHLLWPCRHIIQFEYILKLFLHSLSQTFKSPHLCSIFWWSITLNKCYRDKTGTNNNGIGNNKIGNDATSNNKTGNHDRRFRGLQNNLMNRSMIWQF